MRDALFSPLSKRDINMQVAAAFDMTGQAQPFIRSLVQFGPVGIELHPTAVADCSDADLEFAAAPVALSWSNYDNVRIQWQRVAMRLCGNGRTDAMKYGIVAELRTPVPAPGPYQMRVAIRNLAKGENAGALQLGGLIRRDSMDPVQTPRDLLMKSSRSRIGATARW
ncbi:MAG: hypothetical protein WA324_08695 [Bryobacteraceae bacterium]